MCMPDLLASGSAGECAPAHRRPATPGPAYRRGVRTRTDTRRPTPLQWVRYALGGRLPRQLSAWVLADTTEPGWWRRHLARAASTEEGPPFPPRLARSARDPGGGRSSASPGSRRAPAEGPSVLDAEAD